LIIPFFIIILISDIFAKEYRIELINEKSSKGMNIRHLRLVDIFPQKLNNANAKEYRIELINEKNSKGMNIRHLRLVDIFPQKLNNANQVILLKKNNGNLFIPIMKVLMVSYKLAANDKDERILFILIQHPKFLMLKYSTDLKI